MSVSSHSSSSTWKREKNFTALPRRANAFNYSVELEPCAAWSDACARANVSRTARPYANGSANSAKSTTDGTWVPNTPKATAAGGFVYDHHGLYASLLAKWVGPRFGDTGDSQYLGGFATADISLGLDLDKVMHTGYGAKIKLNIQNIIDNTRIINLAGYTVGAGTPLYWTQPGRSTFATLELKL